MKRSFFCLTVICLIFSVGSSCNRSATLPRGVKTTLVYTIEPPGNAATAKLDPADVMAVVKRRLYVMVMDEVEVKAHGTNQLTLEFPEGEEQTIDRVKQSLTESGHLEFRILANRLEIEDGETIDLAETQSNDNASVAVRDVDGKILAEWVRLIDSNMNLDANSCVLRKLNGEKQEVLALVDEWNISNKHIVKSVPTLIDGKLEVSFEMSARGGRLLEELTGENLPKRNGTRRELAIILDHRLITAPIIQSKISRHAVISGRFSHDEIYDLAAMIGSGELPATLRLVSDSRSKNK